MIGIIIEKENKVIINYVGNLLDDSKEKGTIKVYQNLYDFLQKGKIYLLYRTLDIIVEVESI